MKDLTKNFFFQQPTTISVDEPLATAYLYTRKEFPFLKKK